MNHLDSVPPEIPHMFSSVPSPQTQAAENLEDLAQFGDFFSKLDEKLRLRNERQMRKVMAWGELLDAAGWCVALRKPGNGGLWLSDLAKQDMQRSTSLPSSWIDLLDASNLIPAGSRYRRSEGVLIWSEQSAASHEFQYEGHLTKREAEVVAWLQAGKTSSEIAIILGCAPRTVDKHLANLYRKIGVRDRASVILKARKSSN